MTSPDADHGPNGPRPFSNSPAPFHAMSPLPPAMSPITPATRSAAASVVHEDHVADDETHRGQADPHDRHLPADGAAFSADGGANRQTLGPSSAQADLAGLAPIGLDSGLDTMPSTASDQDALQVFSNAAGLGIFGQSPSMPLLATNPHNMSLMMALAHLSASQINSTRPPPDVVTPAHVSLPTLLHGTHDIDMQGDGLHQPGGPAAAAAAAPAPLESFAKIEFADSVFQMTTYAVIIGRDQKALQQARRDERRAEEYQRRVEENAAAGLPPPSPPSQDPLRFSKSYVSEEGGMLGPESDGDADGSARPAKRRKLDLNGSNSNNSQQQDAVKEEEGPADKDKDLIINRQYVSHTPGAAAVDLASLRPSPNHVPFIGIHSPGPNIATKTKAISREHLKILYNQKEGVFEAIPLHKNGFFCEDIHYKEERAILRSGDRIQIKDVEFAFIINGVALGKTGAEEYEEHTKNRRYSEGGKEMSFDFESSHAGEVQNTSSDEEEEEEEEKLADVAREESPSDLSDVAEDEIRDVDENTIMETIENDVGVAQEPEPVQQETRPEPRLEMSSSEIPQELQRSSEMAQDIKPENQLHLLGFSQFGDLGPMPPKKRGPGRPPKNGIMSKREERLRKKQAMELAKKTMPQPPPGEPPIKRKVGRPRKHPRPEDDPDRPEKRKYKPRKPKGEDGQEISDGERPIKEKRREKPKTPPLELRKEDFTEEQLQKPNKNYGVLIDEVLTEAAGDGLTLKQIYKRIQRKYPYYYFVVDTKGWESSVRHNLIGNDAFKKNEETHLWSRVPGIELDAGKKRKAPSPDQAAASLHHAFGQHHYPQQQMPHAGMYQAQQHMAAQHGYQPNAMAPPGYPPATNQHMHQPQQNQPPPAGSPPQPQYNGLQPGVANPQQLPQAPRPVYPVPPPAPVSAQLPGYGPPAPNRPLQLGAQGQSSTYSSPYASKPPPAPTPPTAGVGAAPTPPTQPAQQPHPPGQPQQQQQQQQHPYPQQAPQPVQPGQPGQPPAQYNPQQQQQQQQQHYPQQRQPPYQPQGQAPSQAPGQPSAPVQMQQPHVQTQPGQQPAPNQAPPRPPTAPTAAAAPQHAPAPLEPAVKPEVVNFIKNFKKNVMEHLSKRTDQAEAVTLSVINRGLGLTEASMVPEQEGIEKVVLGVFEQTRDKAYPSHVLQPGLVRVLRSFKTKWVDTLGTKLGKAKAEALLLSAIDRFLGFSDRTALAGSEQEKKEYERAEDMLIPQLRSDVTNYQNLVAAGGSR